MSKQNTQSVCKKCRRASEKLFLKGERCSSPKCAMVKRPYIPGLHGGPGRRPRRSFSEYGQQLAEKQKLRRIYGLSESQFEKYVEKAINQKEDQKTFLITALESRLDNVIYRLGWAKSRALARQIVSHGHVLVNGRRLNIPSAQVKKDDVISLKERFKNSPLLKDLNLKQYKAPTWLALDAKKMEGKVAIDPSIEEIDQPIEVSKIIEFYSR